jgi:hypothetical protein
MMEASMSRRALRAFFVATCALLASRCVATPLPDPPSADARAMSLVSSTPTTVTLLGRDGAIQPGGTRIRVTDPVTGNAGGRREVHVTASGAFQSEIAGSTADTIYVELLEASGVRFLAAVRDGGGGAAVSADPGPDRDGDGSPDAIDCAPDDPSLRGRECKAAGTACTTDANCAAGQSCVAGQCTTTGCLAAEICGNGLDDDCNGVIDDGC